MGSLATCVEQQGPLPAGYDENKPSPKLELLSHPINYHPESRRACRLRARSCTPSACRTQERVDR
jgi:hypothetical protein